MLRNAFFSLGRSPFFVHHRTSLCGNRCFLVSWWQHGLGVHTFLLHLACRAQVGLLCGREAPIRWTSGGRWRARCPGCRTGCSIPYWVPPCTQALAVWLQVPMPRSSLVQSGMPLEACGICGRGPLRLCNTPWLYSNCLQTVWLVWKELCNLKKGGSVWLFIWEILFHNKIFKYQKFSFRMQVIYIYCNKLKIAFFFFF